MHRCGAMHALPFCAHYASSQLKTTQSAHRLSRRKDQLQAEEGGSVHAFAEACWLIRNSAKLHTPWLQ
jgi:hypothetical protein